ncbi:uncharacterized protein LOC134196440 [Corticium candelabrum]|uniref:uncharacterized protein LOC134196440 n=1 Tax=Corticium candelabrum TaxID=121492 RepID=UPI002E2647C1|nr:uncharacterized protein LOC134196440 [Corticium candelabrum]
MYPLIVIGILITANLLQFASCLSRSRPFYGTAPGHVQTRTEVNCTDPDRHVNMCSNPISSYLLLDIMYALGYFYTLYIFRYNEEEIESVETLITNIFRLNTAGTNNKIRPPKKTLRAILIFGIIWVLLQCVTNILVIVARILDCHVTAKGRVGFSTWIAVGGELPITVMYVLTVLVVLGFIGMDMMFLAVSANYGAQCEMLIFLFRCFNEKIQARAIPLEEAKKEYHRIGKYIDSLGKRFAVAMSLMEVIFIAQAVVSFISLYDVKNSATNGTTEKLFFTVGMSYVFLWFVIAMFPLTQAARLNSACNTTVQVLLDVCVFHYRDASQSDINLFISYMTLHSKQTKARLFYLPIYIGHIFGLLAVAFTVFVPLSELDIIKFRLW